MGPTRARRPARTQAELASAGLPPGRAASPRCGSAKLTTLFAPPSFASSSDAPICRHRPRISISPDVRGSASSSGYPLPASRTTRCSRPSDARKLQPDPAGSVLHAVLDGIGDQLVDDQREAMRALLRKPHIGNVRLDRKFAVGALLDRLGQPAEQLARRHLGLGLRLVDQVLGRRERPEPLLGGRDKEADLGGGGIRRRHRQQRHHHLDVVLHPVLQLAQQDPILGQRLIEQRLLANAPAQLLVEMANPCGQHREPVVAWVGAAQHQRHLGRDAGQAAAMNAEARLAVVGPEDQRAGHRRGRRAGAPQIGRELARRRRQQGVEVTRARFRSEQAARGPVRRQDAAVLGEQEGRLGQRVDDPLRQPGGHLSGPKYSRARGSRLSLG